VPVQRPGPVHYPRCERGSIRRQYFLPGPGAGAYVLLPENMTSLLVWCRLQNENRCRRSAGGKQRWCERRYLVSEQWYNQKPDALAEYHVGSQRMRFWLEWDHGTLHVRDLAVNFPSYAHYIASREWARERSMLPVLVCVAPDIAQASLTSPPRLVVWTTT
jgi:hypothetical protein